MDIIEEEETEYRLVYDDENGCGYAFPCDAQGNILWDKCPYPETTKKSLAKAKAQDDWAKNGVVETRIHRNRYGVCPSCGRRVYFGGCGWAAYLGTAECECGIWFNVFGQALKPPEDWYDD